MSTELSSSSSAAAAVGTPPVKRLLLEGGLMQRYPDAAAVAYAAASRLSPPTPTLTPAIFDPLCHGVCDGWKWDAGSKSHEVVLSSCGRTAHFHPNWSNGTAAVRGSKPINGARHFWEVKVSKKIFGTSMMFGVGTSSARLHENAFMNLVGSDEHSWGLSHKGLAWHGGKAFEFAAPFAENTATTVGLLFDGVSGTLTYYRDGVCLGVAFTGLHQVSQPLYPMVCSTAAKTEMVLGATSREAVAPLLVWSRRAVVRSLRSLHRVDRIPGLPKTLLTYLKEDPSQ